MYIVVEAEVLCLMFSENGARFQKLCFGNWEKRSVPVLFVALTNQRCVSWPRNQSSGRNGWIGHYRCFTFTRLRPGDQDHSQSEANSRPSSSLIGSDHDMILPRVWVRWQENTERWRDCEGSERLESGTRSFLKVLILLNLGIVTFLISENRGTFEVSVHHATLIHTAMTPIQFTEFHITPRYLNCLFIYQSNSIVYWSLKICWLMERVEML